MWVFLGLTIDFSEIRVFANKGCTETHLICVSQTLTRFRYSLLDGLASTSRGLLLLNLLVSFFFVFFFACLIFQHALLNVYCKAYKKFFGRRIEKKNEKERKRRKTKNENQLGFNGLSMYRAEASF